MNTRTRQPVSAFTMAMAVAVVLLTWSSTPYSVRAQVDPSPKEVADKARTKAAQAHEAKLRRILARQKGDQLEVYLEDATGMYVNGTSISSSDLATIIRESGLDRARVSANLEVKPARVEEVKQLIQKSGIAKVVSIAPKKTLREVAEARRERAANKRAATLRAILFRQKGDQLKVYLRNGKAMFVNGKQISEKTLAAIIAGSGLDKAVITAEPRVPNAKVTAVRQVLRDNGAKDISVIVRK